MKLDKFTEGIIKISYTRVLIEINSFCEFSNKILIVSEKDDILWQDAVYEWRPDICPNCFSFGHVEANC